MIEEEKAYLELLKEVDAEIDKIHNKYKEKIKKAKEKALRNCKHNFYSIHKERCDDGYGKWYTLEYKHCQICGAEDAYQKWPLK